MHPSTFQDFALGVKREVLDTEVEPTANDRSLDLNK